MAAAKRSAFRKVELSGSYTSQNRRHLSIGKGIGALVEQMPEGAELVLDAKNVVEINDGGRTLSALSSLTAKAVGKLGKLTIVVESNTQVYGALNAPTLNTVTRMPSTPKSAPTWGKQGTGVASPKVEPEQGAEVEMGLAPHGTGTAQWGARW